MVAMLLDYLFYRERGVPPPVGHFALSPSMGAEAAFQRVGTRRCGAAYAPYLMNTLT